MPYMHHLRRDLNDHTSKADRLHRKSNTFQYLVLLALLIFITVVLI